MAMTPEIKSAIQSFKDIIIGGVPLLLNQNETALLSFMCTVAAIDVLAGYRYTVDKVGIRFKFFVKQYFPSRYISHAENLYKLRCRLLHNFSPAYFSLTHSSPKEHLQKSRIGDTILSDEVFFSDMKDAALMFFNDVEQDPLYQYRMNKRLLNLVHGGAIFYEWSS